MRYLLSMVLVGMLAGCEAEPPRPARVVEAPLGDVAFLADDAVWREQRRQDLLRPDGWASLVGLHWLELKAHYLGSGTGIANSMRLAVGPPRMGMVEQQDGRVYFTPESGAALTLAGKPFTDRAHLASDHEDTPAVVGFDEGKGSLSVIRRGDRFGLRIRHADAPTRLQFKGIGYWPPQPDWRITGKFIPHPPGKTLPIVDIIGTASDAPNPGMVEFVRDGKTHRIEAMGEPGGELFLVIADRTSGHGSYPAGRFMDTPPPDTQGNVVLDFNRAYNPPCAFTSFATCPLPPPENRLDLAITAGEKTHTPPATAP